MKLRIPPVLVFLFIALAMFFVSKKMPTGSFVLFGSNYISIIFLFSGILLGLFSLNQFRKSRTTINPLKPIKSTSLVTNGIYKYTRNPMYVSLLFVLISLSLYLKNVFNVFLLIGFVSYMNAYQIKPEEKALLQIFGLPYQNYCKKVRRWL